MEAPDTHGKEAAKALPLMPPSSELKRAAQTSHSTLSRHFKDKWFERSERLCIYFHIPLFLFLSLHMLVLPCRETFLAGWELWEPPSLPATPFPTTCLPLPVSSPSLPSCLPPCLPPLIPAPTTLPTFPFLYLIIYYKTLFILNFEKQHAACLGGIIHQLSLLMTIPYPLMIQSVEVRCAAHLPLSCLFLLLPLLPHTSCLIIDINCMCFLRRQGREYPGWGKELSHHEAAYELM